MGYDLPPSGVTYRIMGQGPARTGRRIGAGVMDKSGVRDDLIDFRAGTWSLVWLLRGAGTYTDAQGRTLSLTAGDAFQRWPGLSHSTRCDPTSGWYEVFLDLGPELAGTLADLGMLRRDLTVWRLGRDAARLRRWLAVRDALVTAHDRDLPGLCVAIQQEVVGATAQAVESTGQDLIDAACRRLAETAVERDELAAFCAEHGLQYEAFRKRFRRRTGLSPGQYRIRRRLERACALLQTTDAPVAAIAADLGYASPFEFSAQFRRHLGTSPRAYRGR